jgi:peptidoglycan/xylan/chitin deacetylase (PgdA/CDA1 family)
MSGLKGGQRLWLLLVLLLVVATAAYITFKPEWPFSAPTAFTVVLEPNAVTPTVIMAPETTGQAGTARMVTTPVEAGVLTVNPVSTIALEDNAFVVLCYHRFVAHPEKFKEPLSEYQFPLAEFRWQMQYLKDNGITPISMQQLKDYWFGGKPLPAKSVLLTFDDGFRSLYDVMFPVLKEFKYPGVLFLYTDFIRDKDALTLGDIKVMQKYGMALESHTKSHPNLGYVEEKQTPKDFAILLTQELSDPVSYIQKEFGYKATTLAYPYGVYNDTIVDETQREDYQLAFTVNPGPNDRTVPPLKLKRDLILNPMNHETFAALFESKVLHLDKIKPGDGEFIQTHTPTISMIVKDDVDYKTIRLFLGTAAVSYRYDPQTHELKHQFHKSLKSGGHFISVSATDLNGIKRNYTWYFRIKHFALGVEPSKKEDKLKGVDDK